jgi:hypothetical protein
MYIYTYILQAHVPVILATKEDVGLKADPGYHEKTLHKKGLVEWLKV